MRRRDFLAALASVPGWPRAASGQQGTSARRIPVVGYVGFASSAVADANLLPFRQGLNALGYIEGQTISIEVRTAHGDVARGRTLIAELAALPVDVFLSPGPAASRAVARATTIPIVAVALPAGESAPDLFASLARPGGTVTGFSAFGEEMSAKRIEMLKEIVPGLKTLGVFHNSTDPSFRAWGDQTIADANRSGLEAVRMGIDSPSTEVVDKHFRTLSDKGGAAVIVIRDFLTAAMMNDICKAGLDARIPVVGEYDDFAQAGALFSYGADLGDLFRRAAGYVDRILKGEKAANLPIQLPTKFEMTINAKTAQRLGIPVPASILVRADHVIE